MDDAKEAMAFRYVLGELTGSEEQRFYTALEQDQELREFAREIQAAFASMALAVPPITAPSGMPAKIVRENPKVSTRKVIRVHFIPWALAACLTVMCAVLAIDRMHLERTVATLRDQTTGQARELADLRDRVARQERELADLRDQDARQKRELAELRQRDILAQVRIATLQAQVNAFARTGAVVVWDPIKKAGVVQFQNLPAPPAGKNYQLWILDPKSPQPISAGLVAPSRAGLVRANLEPSKPVESAAKFAVSIENSGGSQTPHGPIVLIGQ